MTDEVRKWRDGLQKYCDENAMNVKNGGRCLCGNMAYCAECPMDDVRFPCVSAIISYCRENGVEIDYTDCEYSKLIDKIGFRRNANRKWR